MRKRDGVWARGGGVTMERKNETYLREKGEIEYYAPVTFLILYESRIVVIRVCSDADRLGSCY